MPKRIACSAWDGFGNCRGRFASYEAGANWAGCQLEGVRRAANDPKRTAGGYLWKREEPIAVKVANCPRCRVSLPMSEFAQRPAADGGTIRNGCCKSCDILRQRAAWRTCSKCGKKHRARAQVCFRCMRDGF